MQTYPFQWNTLLYYALCATAVYLDALYVNVNLLQSRTSRISRAPRPLLQRRAVTKSRDWLSRHTPPLHSRLRYSLPHCSLQKLSARTPPSRQPL